MGKILRINTDGSVPQGNPSAQVPGADPTVYSIGLCQRRFQHEQAERH
jgi:hypothetical protein